MQPQGRPTTYQGQGWAPQAGYPSAQSQWPGYGTPGYGTPGYGTPGYGTPGYGAPGYGAPGHRSAPQQPAPQPAPRRRPLSGLSGAQLLAWTGGAVTLLGVVLLLVLAASRGWFSPQARVVAGAVLGIALVGLGVWLHRKETARVGALALAATGFATLYLVVAAATAYYGYLPTLPALLAALVVAGGGLGLADRWRSQLLGGGVVAGAMLLAPVLVTDWRLVALALALQLAALPVVLRKRWPVLMLIAAAGPFLFGTLVGFGPLVGPAATERAGAIAVVLAALAVGLATVLLAARRLPVPPVAVLLAASPAPLLVTAAEVEGVGGAGLAAVAALALAAVAVAVAPGVDRVLRTVGTAAAAVALFVATQLVLDGAAVTVAVLGEALVATMAAAALRSRVLLAVGAAFGAFATLVAITRDAPLEALLRFSYVEYAGPSTVAELTAAGVSVLVLALAVALLVAGGRTGLVRPDATAAPLWVPVGLVGLYGATSLVVTLALLVAPDRAGFTAGHALVTVSWTVAALVLLACGISRPALRITGMVLVGAAVAKLVLFDLVALDGLARVGAFLGAGLVLLAAGTRYARMVAEAEKATAGETATKGEPRPDQAPPPAAG
ncbi:DUF2339 domain-containing protein [Pseudonocardia aurantiaca]